MNHLVLALVIFVSATAAIVAARFVPFPARPSLPVAPTVKRRTPPPAPVIDGLENDDPALADDGKKRKRRQSRESFFS